MLARFAGPIGIALLASGFVVQLIDQLVKPGGPFDRRYRRNIETEFAVLTSKKEKEEITQGRRELRVTTMSGLRGPTDQVRSNQDFIKEGIRLTDLDQVLAKNIGVANI